MPFRKAWLGLPYLGKKLGSARLVCDAKNRLILKSKK